MAYNNYDENKLASFIDKKDYFGAANYIKSFKAPTVNEQKQLNNYIKQLEREGNIQDALYNRMDDDTKQAYSFINAYDDGGVIPTSTKDYNNEYGDYFSNKINALTASRPFKIQDAFHSNPKDVIPIKSLSFYIDNDYLLDQFKSKANIDDIRNNNFDINFEKLKDNQGYKLTIDRNNPNILRIYDAIKKTRSENELHWYDYLTDQRFYDSAKYLLGTLLGKDVEEPKQLTNNIRIEGNVDKNIMDSMNLSKFDNEAYTETRSNLYSSDLDCKDKININKQIDKKCQLYKNVYTEDELNLNVLDDALDKIEDARDKVNKFNEQEKERLGNVKQKLVTTGYLSATHAALADALNSGKINTTTYNALLKESDDAYNRVLIGSDWTQGEVYSWDLDSGEGRLLKRTDNADIPNLQAEFEVALHDGRATKELAYMGGDIGTLITITGKSASEKNNDDWSAKKGEKPRQIFLKGVFSGKYEDLYNLDTKVQAMKENEDMQYYGYAKSVSDTEKVGYTSDGQPYLQYIDDNTKRWVRRSITEDELLNRLNDNLIIENTVEKAMENDGGDKNDNYYSVIFDAFAKQAMAERMPEGSYPELERIKYKNEMYQRMIKLLAKYRALRDTTIGDYDNDDN